MSSPFPLHRLVLFGLYGALAGFLIALLLGEFVWWLLAPSSPEGQAFVPSGPVLAHTPPPLPPPVPQLAITASPRVSVYPGGQNTVRVRLARAHFNAPVALQWTSSPPGLSATDLTIPADQTSGQVVVKAAADAPPGVYQLTATATDEGHVVSTTAKVEVTVVKIPPVGARLAVSVSPKIPVYQNSKNAFGVRVARGEFTGEIAIAFSSLPEGVIAPTVTIPADKTDATAELMAEGDVPTGVHKLMVTARGGPKGDLMTTAEARVEVLASPKLPLDLVFVLDCTGSMKKPLAGIRGTVPQFAKHLGKAQLDVRFGLVGFQDTTLGQRLRILRVNNDKLTTDFAQFGEAMGELRLGGGGGEGESSLDGLAEAADYPFREGAARVALLITDGGPKRIDGRMKSMDETVKYLREKKINQLHIVALPEHKKPFEPLWAGAKGNFFDLKEANAAESYDKLMAEVAKAISAAAPPPSVGKPPQAIAAPDPDLSSPDLVKPPTLPAGAEPDEPKLEQVITSGVSMVIPDTPEKPTEQPEPPKGYPVLALVGWASVVTSLVCLAVLLGQLTFLPGERPILGVAAVGYGMGVAVGLSAGAGGYLAFDLVGVPFLGRLTAASVFGLCVG